jgi:alpha 1,2-mannosyltransferase
MIRASSNTVRRYCILCIYACLIIGISYFATLSSIEHWRLSVCLSNYRNNTIIDRQDEWRYQNSITGEWFHWRTVYKKQSNNASEWRVNWLNVAPTSYLGVIVYLTKLNELNSLNMSLAQLSRLLSNNPRPVVIFHEGDLSRNDTQHSLARTLGSRTPLAFERIKFSNGSNRPGPTFPRYQLGYLHMCRFFTLMLPTHPLLTLFSFYWRLDTHSYIFGSKPIQDPFEIMQKKQIQYAFTMANEEGEWYADGLWSFFHEFLNRHCLKPSLAFRKTQIGWFRGYSSAIFFTNCAIANVSLFRDHPLIHAWLHEADDNGGIYRSRWGDAPVHTLALTQFIERKHIARLRYFGYFHRREYICASGVEKKLCEEQVQPFITETKVVYDHYEDDCSPFYRNPLCRYYPEIQL